MSVRRLEPGQVIGGFKLEAPDPAAAILEYAVTNQVDHIIVGAWSHGDGRQSELSGAVLAIIRKSAVYCGADRSRVGAKRTSGCSGAGSAV